MDSAFDISSVDDLISSLIRLKADWGEITGDRFWVSDGWIDITSQLDRHSISKAISSIQRTKRSFSLLTSLKSSHHDYIRTLTTSVLRFGLTTLPSEILIRIFVLACSKDSGPMRADYLHIAGVCRRFREVVNGYGPFWRSVSNWWPRGFTEVQLERSGLCGINVSYRSCLGEGHGSTPRCSCFDVFEPIVRHSDQWETFRFDGSGRLLRDEPHCQDLFDRLCLPSLQSLYATRTASDCADRSCTTWIMPHLQDLMCDAGLLEMRFPESCELRRLKLDTRCNTNAEAQQQGTSILRFLEQAPVSNHLQILILSLGNSSFNLDIDATPHPIRCILLKQLRILVLDFDKLESEYSSNILKILLQALSTPNLVELSLAISVRSIQDPLRKKWMDYIIPQRLPRLHQVNFALETNIALAQMAMNRMGDDSLQGRWREVWRDARRGVGICGGGGGGGGDDSDVDAVTSIPRLECSWKSRLELSLWSRSTSWDDCMTNRW